MAVNVRSFVGISGCLYKKRIGTRSILRLSQEVQTHGKSSRWQAAD